MTRRLAPSGRQRVPSSTPRSRTARILVRSLRRSPGTAEARAGPRSPRRRRVVLQELAPEVVAGQEAADDRVAHARGAVDDVERGLEAVAFLAERVLGRVLVGDPAGVDRVHVDAGAQ